jgi:hypothetical protein
VATLLARKLGAASHATGIVGAKSYS